MTLEKYVDQIVKRLPCSKKEKRDMRDELLDHLRMLAEEYREEGHDTKQAEQMAMDRFGKEEQISKHICEAMPVLDQYWRRWFMGGLCGYGFILIYLFFLSPDRWRRQEFIVAWKKRMIEYGVPQYTKVFQNTKPFSTISDYIVHYQNYSATTIFLNLFGNILVFIPLGFLLPILFTRFASVNRVFLFSFMTSLLVEIFQYLFMLGSFDVDDILLNSIGALCGFGCYRLSLFLVYRYRNRLFDDQ
ncbi:VanZ family protein [Brevibacillus laterosporus]|uniref:VanZ family protein n=1 Tax=Brevibacillus laterosporus TaxID=1465 RepID=A0A518VAM1_BRELA|nr:VanZ family protein [Brevibacillus laterosporus]